MAKNKQKYKQFLSMKQMTVAISATLILVILIVTLRDVYTHRRLFGQISKLEYSLATRFGSASKEDGCTSSKVGTKITCSINLRFETGQLNPDKSRELFYQLVQELENQSDVVLRGSLQNNIQEGVEGISSFTNIYEHGSKSQGQCYATIHADTSANGKLDTSLRCPYDIWWKKLSIF